jgi:copper resistance protein B
VKAQLLLTATALALPAAALAQAADPQAGHAMSPPAQPAQDPHAGHRPPASQPAADPHAGHHGMHGAAPAAPPAADPSPGPLMETPAPSEAGSGPPRAADAIWGADAMQASRAALPREHGDFPVLWVQGDRLEAQVRDGADAWLWDVQGYYGGPTSRFWFKSEGEGAFGEPVEQAEIQGLWSRAVAPFWDVQLGVRQDVAGPSTTHAVIGLQGLAPYLFEVDAALFVSHRGDITARIEAETDQRITRRLILQPRAEIELSAQDIPQLGIGAGIDTVELGVRLRYEIIREFAPYIGIEQSWRVGNGADFARAAGDDTRATSFLVGLRVWF